MSWAVGWDGDQGRHRGYGVPAYCDAKGCETEIDRGLGYVCEGDACGCHDADDLEVTTFVCGEHTCADVDWSDVPEHPDWIAHVSTDDSWARWRDEYPGRFAALPASPASTRPEADR